VHVPFNGAGPAVASTIGGHTPIAFGSPASSVAQVQDGKLRGLAVASGKRLVALPDLPTMAQAGFPDIDVEFWIGIFAPAATPKDIVAALNRQVDKAVALPDVRQRLDALGFEAAAIGSADSATKLKSESVKWAKVVQAAGIKAG
jgi:tripartite-type tricarboxylate transporter receptor subunit TctC